MSQENTINVVSTTDKTEEPQEAVQATEEIVEEVEETETDLDESEVEGKEGEESESSEEEVEEEGEEKPKAKKKSGFQRRIDKLTEKRIAAEQRAQYLEQRMRDLEAKLESAPKSEKEPIEQETEEPGKPSPHDFEYHEDYVEALTDWKLEQKLAKRDAEHEVKSQQAQLVKEAETFKQRINDFAKEHEDFDEVVDEIKHIQPTKDFQDFIRTAENPGELLYLMGKDPENFERVASMQGPRLFREIGRIEASLNLEPSQKETKTATRAPKPLKKVSTKSSGSKKSIYSPNLTQAEYEKLRMEQLSSR